MNWSGKRWLFQVIVAGAGLSISPIQAFAQGTADTNDTAFRAAYCVGVLKGSIRLLQEQRPDVFQCATRWAEFKFESAEECVAAMPTVAQAVEALQVPLEAKHQRYKQYLAIRYLSKSLPADAVLALMSKGEKDALEKQSKAADTALSRCRFSGDDIVNCVARYDQVHANILRCLLSPDQLPF